MAHWFELDNGIWYYFNSKAGSMKPGWLLDNRKWYYLNGDGTMKTSWLKLPKHLVLFKWRRFHETRWLLNHNKWCFFSDVGYHKTGWLLKDGRGTM